MIHSIRFKCLLDTNVIFPIEIRDLLFWFAYDDLYTPKWSKHIFRKNQNLDEYQILEFYRNNGLKDTANYLHALL